MPVKGVRTRKEPHVNHATAVFAGLLFARAFLLSAAESPQQTTKPKPVYTHYQDWQFQAVTVPDDQADGRVRRQMDFTVPVHGPWLLNPAPDSITINWITRVPCAGGLEYREKGTQAFTRRWRVTYGQIDYSKDLHTFHLNNLKPGTEYEYRLLSASDRFFGAYNDVHTGRELRVFKTIDPKRTHYRAFVTADFHGSARLCLDPMIARCDAANADFYFFLGDTVEDGPGDNLRFFTTFGFLDDVSRLWGKNKATVYLRGNHDLWGRDTYQYGDYFPRQDGRTYLAFAQGPVLFIGLDTMWTVRETLQNEQYEKYRVEQAEWIRGLKKTPAWKNATFRVAMAHVAPYASEGARFVRPAFHEVLNDNTNEGRVHIFLAGHEHKYWRIDPLSQEIKVGKQEPDLKKSKDYLPNYIRDNLATNDCRYAVVVLHLVEGMTIDVSPEKLVFQSHRWNNPDGGLYDAFAIAPDGKVTDLMEVERFPLVPIPPKDAKKE